MKNGYCGFFRWKKRLGESISPGKNCKGSYFEKDKVITELEAKNIILDKKVKKLKIKRDNLEEVMQDMTNELCQMHAALIKHSRGEKYAVVAIVMSWLIFSIVVMVRNL